MTNEEAAAPRYAQALFDAARKSGELEKVGEDLRDLLQVLKPSGLKSFLENPQHPAERKLRVISEIGSKFRSKLTAAFLGLLLEKLRIGIIHGAARRYAVLMNEALGVVPADITLAGTPNEAFKKSIEQSLAKITGKKVQMTFKADPEILGGIHIRIGNRVIDGSARSGIEELKKALLETKIN